MFSYFIDPLFSWSLFVYTVWWWKKISITNVFNYLIWSKTGLYVSRSFRSEGRSIKKKVHLTWFWVVKNLGSLISPVSRLETGFKPLYPFISLSIKWTSSSERPPRWPFLLKLTDYRPLTCTWPNSLFVKTPGSESPHGYKGTPRYSWGRPRVTFLFSGDYEINPPPFFIGNTVYGFRNRMWIFSGKEFLLIKWSRIG